MVSHIHQYVTGHYFHVHDLDSVSLAVAGAVAPANFVAMGGGHALHFHPDFQALEIMLAEKEREAVDG